VRTRGYDNFQLTAVTIDNGNNNYYYSVGRGDDNYFRSLSTVV